MTTMDEGRRAAMSIDDVESMLREGNDRFATGASSRRDWLADAAATAEAQHPVAAIVGCIDSRVPVEAVFDLGIGDAFVARVAGNVVDDDVLGSLEFATAIAGAKEVVVLGHESCGAVTGACAGVELGHVTGLLAKIVPAVRAIAGAGQPFSDDDPEFVARVVEEHARATAAGLTDRSAVLRERVEAGELRIRAAVYDLASGRVRWL